MTDGKNPLQLSSQDTAFTKKYAFCDSALQRFYYIKHNRAYETHVDSNNFNDTIQNIIQKDSIFKIQLYAESI